MLRLRLPARRAAVLSTLLLRDTMKTLMDETGEIAHRWGVAGVPASFIVDREGRIAYAGMGYATEAARGMIEFGHRYLCLDTVIATVALEHIASQRVLEKVGMTYVKTQQSRGDNNKA